MSSILVDGYYQDSDIVQPQYVELCAQLKIHESIHSIKPLGDDLLIVTELRIIRVRPDATIVWTHDFHEDIIMFAKRLGDRLEVTDFNDKTYCVDLETGWEVIKDGNKDVYRDGQTREIRTKR